MAHKDWGGDSETLLRLYRSLIRSKLDYACVVYGSARRSYLAMLDPVQNQALRQCLGAFRTSPVDSLHVEANEPPLGHRRNRLAIQYLTKLKSNPSNPTYQCVFTPQFTRLFEEKQHMIAPFGVRMGCLILKMQLTITAVALYRLPNVEPWLLNLPRVSFRMHVNTKSASNPKFLQTLFYTYLEHNVNYFHIYTLTCQRITRVLQRLLLVKTDFLKSASGRSVCI